MLLRSVLQTIVSLPCRQLYQTQTSQNLTSCYCVPDARVQMLCTFFIHVFIPLLNICGPDCPELAVYHCIRECINVILRQSGPLASVNVHFGRSAPIFVTFVLAWKRKMMSVWELYAPMEWNHHLLHQDPENTNRCWQVPMTSNGIPTSSTTYGSCFPSLKKCRDPMKMPLTLEALQFYSFPSFRTFSQNCLMQPSGTM